MSGPLKGITILDLSRDVPGSYACMILGDMGASVIKVESPNGSAERSSPAFHLWNRGKKSLALDYRHTQGQKVLEKLIEKADVLVETFLPQEVREQNLEYAGLSQLNPRLIYCALPPFGDSGPLSSKPADSGIVDAYAGVYGDQGGPDSEPVFIHLPISHYATAMMASYAISTALFARETTGKGQKIELPWYSGTLAVEAHLLISGTEALTDFKRQRNQLGSNPVYRLYQCQDGWLFLACGNSVFWNKLCIALEMEYLTADERFLDAPWGIPLEHHKAMTSIMEPIFRENTLSYWLDLLGSYGIPTAPVRSREEYYSHPQVVHNGILVDVDDPVLGATKQPGVFVTMSKTPGDVHGPAPQEGQHTKEILLDIGYSGGQIAEMESSGVVKT